MSSTWEVFSYRNGVVVETTIFLLSTSPLLQKKTFLKSKILNTMYVKDSHEPLIKEESGGQVWEEALVCGQFLLRVRKIFLRVGEAVQPFKLSRKGFRESDKESECWDVYDNSFINLQV